MYTVKTVKGRTVAVCGSMSSARKRAARVLSRKGGSVVILDNNGIVVWAMESV